MKKNPFKLYFLTVLLTLILTSLAYGGDTHCPADPPPPPPDGRGEVVIVDTNPSAESNFQVIRGFWKLFIQNADLL